MSTGQIEPMRNIDKLYLLEEKRKLAISNSHFWLPCQSLGKIRRFQRPLWWQRSMVLVTPSWGLLYKNTTMTSNSWIKEGRKSDLPKNRKIDEKSTIIPEWVVDAVK